MQAVVGGSDLDLTSDGGLERGSEFVRIVDEDEPRGQKLHQKGKLAKILRHQRIGRRHRAERNARIQGAERHQRVIDRIAGENKDWFFGRKIARQKTGRDAPAYGEQFGIGDLAPAAARVALRHKDTVGRSFSPMMQPVGQPGRIVAERLSRLEINRAVGAALDRDDGVAEGNPAQRSGAAALRRRPASRRLGKAGSRAHVSSVPPLPVLPGICHGP
jgi:hypothetical protein